MGSPRESSLAPLNYCTLKMTFMIILINLVVDCSIRMLLISFHMQKILKLLALGYNFDFCSSLGIKMKESHPKMHRNERLGLKLNTC